MAIRIRAPSAHVLASDGIDFQCSIPPLCTMVTQQDFGFPVKILRLLPDVCDNVLEMLRYCKQSGQQTADPFKGLSSWG